MRKFRVSSKMTSAFVLASALVLAVGLSACGGKKETPKAETKGAEAPKKDDAKKKDEAKKEDAKKKDDGKKKEAEKKKEAKPSFEEQVKESTPLSPKPKDQTVAGKTVKAQLCKVDGGPWVGKSTSRLFKAAERVGDHLVVSTGDGLLHGFKIEASDASCALTYDAAFGDKGKLKLKDKIEYLDSDSKGRLIAAHGIFNIYGVEGGKETFKCKTGGYPAMHSSGKWAIAPWVNATVKAIEFKGTSCDIKDWVLKDLSKDDKRKGPFANVNTASVIGDTVFIGGILPKKDDPKESRVVIAFDKAGKELFRFGNTKDNFADDKFGWVHGIEECGKNLCVLDANMRQVSLWSKDKGEFVGAVKLKDLLDLKYPWVAGISADAKGEVWLAVAQNRDKSKVAEGLVYRVTGM